VWEEDFIGDGCYSLIKWNTDSSCTFAFFKQSDACQFDGVVASVGGTLGEVCWD
jgi:hypothetical protein